MATSDLLKFARAKDDQEFLWRIGAAMTLKAQEQEGWELTPSSRALTDFMIDHPMEHVERMYLHVVTNPAVAANISVRNDGTVKTNDVPDGDIIYVVSQKWDAVAEAMFPVIP